MSFDLAAHLTLLVFTLRELPSEAATTNALINRLMELCGLRDLSTLIQQKEDGFSVFGQQPIYPNASEADVLALIRAIAERLQNLQPIPADTDATIPAPAGWTATQPDAIVNDWTIAAYASPLN